MGRPAKPFQYRNNWVSTIGGKLTILAPISPNDGKTPPDAVLMRLAALRMAAGNQPSLTSILTVRQAFEQYLTAKEQEGRKCAKTIETNRYVLKRVLDKIGGMALGKVALVNAKAVSQSYADTSVSTHNSAIKTLRAMWKWAMQNQLVSDNPFALVELKRGEGCRQRIVTDQEFRSLLRVANREDKQTLIFLRWSACRPQDLESKFDWIEGDFMVIPAEHHKTGSKTGEPRLVFLPETLKKLIEWRKRNLDQERLFHCGKRFHDKFIQLRRKAGIKAVNGEELQAYHLRHTRITEAAFEYSGDLITVQAVSGHKTLSMVQRYCHAATLRNKLLAGLKNPKRVG